MRRVTVVFVSALLCGVLHSAAWAQQPPAPASETKAPAQSLVNLNTATQAELESLPGIGARTAERILEYRKQSGGFKKIEELMIVKGIGEKAFLKLKPRIVVTPPKA